MVLRLQLLVLLKGGLLVVPNGTVGAGQTLRTQTAIFQVVGIVEERAVVVVMVMMVLKRKGVLVLLPVERSTARQRRVRIAPDFGKERNGGRVCSQVCAVDLAGDAVAICRNRISKKGRLVGADDRVKICEHGVNDA